MASITIEETIIVVSTIIATSILAAAVFSGLSRIEASYKSIVTVTEEKVKTDIKIIFAVNTSPSTVKVWIKNVGTSRISSQMIASSDLFFGRVGNFERLSYNANWTYSIVNDDNDGVWESGETIEITISLSYTLSEGDYYILFVLSNGKDAEYTFSV